jgi:pectate lyase
LRLDKDIILDFNKNNIPVAMEILHASKRLKIDKVNLKDLMGLNMNIEVGKDHIHIKAAFNIIIRNKSKPLEFHAEGENSINLPSTETNFAAAAI